MTVGESGSLRESSVQKIEDVLGRLELLGSDLAIMPLEIRKEACRSAVVVQ